MYALSKFSYFHLVVSIFFQDELSESMSSLKSIAQQAVVNAGLENQIPSSTDSISSDTKGMGKACLKQNTVKSKD